MLIHSHSGTEGVKSDFRGCRRRQPRQAPNGKSLVVGPCRRDNPPHGGGALSQGAGPRDVAGSAGSLLAFFVLTFGVAWACFIPVAVAFPTASAPGILIVLLGTISPSLAAVGL